MQVVVLASAYKLTGGLCWGSLHWTSAWAECQQPQGQVSWPSWQREGTAYMPCIAVTATVSVMAIAL